MDLLQYRLFPDDTVNKGTIEHQKSDEKAPTLRCMFLHKYLDKKPHYTQPPFKTLVG